MKIEVYNKNYNKLLKYADASSVKVVYILRNEAASWNRGNKTIQLSPDHSGNVEELAFFLHELGHMRDDYTLGVNKDLDKAYTQFNKLLLKTIKNTNNKNKIMVIDTEHRAWQYGISIAKQLGIRLGKWYYDEMQEGLMSYFETAYPKTYKKKYEEYRKIKG